MLAFFDFYPIISKADSFFDLYAEALGWAFWNFYFCLLITLSILASKYIYRTISLNALSWSFAISYVALFMFGLGEYFIREELGILRGAGRLSDQLLFITESVMILWVITTLLVCGNLVFGKLDNTKSISLFGLRFQSISKWRQRILLSLFFTTLFSYPFLHFPLLILALIGFSFFWLRTKEVRPDAEEQKWADLLPMGLIVLAMIFLAFFNVEDVVQSIPFFKTYF